MSLNEGNHVASLLICNKRITKNNILKKRGKSENNFRGNFIDFIVYIFTYFSFTFIYWIFIYFIQFIFQHFILPYFLLTRVPLISSTSREPGWQEKSCL